MTISSRTLGGIPHRCPICGHEEDMEVSVKTGDSCCPSCGQLMWRKEHSTGPEHDGQPRRRSRRKLQPVAVPAGNAERNNRPMPMQGERVLTNLMHRFLSLFLPREVRTGWCAHYFVSRRDR